MHFAHILCSWYFQSFAFLSSFAFSYPLLLPRTLPFQHLLSRLLLFPHHAFSNSCFSRTLLFSTLAFLILRLFSFDQSLLLVVQNPFHPLLIDVQFHHTYI
ncbi:MAG: hypothetical protein JOS17DRAFT_740968, partial [Linnemannia elongata]